MDKEINHNFTSKSEHEELVLHSIAESLDYLDSSAESLMVSSSSQTDKKTEIEIRNSIKIRSRFPETFIWTMDNLGLVADYIKL